LVSAMGRELQQSLPHWAPPLRVVKPLANADSGAESAMRGGADAR